MLIDFIFILAFYLCQWCLQGLDVGKTVKHHSWPNSFLHPFWSCCPGDMSMQTLMPSVKSCNISRLGCLYRLMQRPVWVQNGQYHFSEEHACQILFTYKAWPNTRDEGWNFRKNVSLYSPKFTVIVECSQTLHHLNKNKPWLFDIRCTHKSHRGELLGWNSSLRLSSDELLFFDVFQNLYCVALSNEHMPCLQTSGAHLEERNSQSCLATP